jgi:hypothetical protein
MGPLPLLPLANSLKRKEMGSKHWQQRRQLGEAKGGAWWPLVSSTSSYVEIQNNFYSPRKLSHYSSSRRRVNFFISYGSILLHLDVDYSIVDVNSGLRPAKARSSEVTHGLNMRWWEVKNNKTNQQANNAVLTLIGCLKHI